MARHQQAEIRDRERGRRPRWRAVCTASRPRSRRARSSSSFKPELGVTWRTETVDTFKAGNPDTAVRGIATTVMATMSVLERAAAAGRNFVITHEPTFYGHTDSTAEIETDPIYQRKAELIKKHDLVVWRFHDHWHMRRPEPMTQGFYPCYRVGAGTCSHRAESITVPETTLEARSGSARTGSTSKPCE